MLSNAGLPLILPAGAQPNLSLILGGAGARLADITAAIARSPDTVKRAGCAYSQAIPCQSGRCYPRGRAWIIRRILANEAQPLPDNALPQVVPLAWKTGTSYGYRDAWAVGLNARYVIGIWTGRPDGTPVAGQFGFASAVPLLNQVNNVLQSGSTLDQRVCHATPRPDAVGTRRHLLARGGQSPAGRERKLPSSPGDPGCWTVASRRRCSYRNRKVFAGSVSRSGWIKRANAWRQTARMRPRRTWMSGRCRWNLAACSRAALSTDPFAIGYLSALIAGLTCTADVDWRA